MADPDPGTPVREIETLGKPTDYPPLQLALAFYVASILNRGKLVLVEPPWDD